MEDVKGVSGLEPIAILNARKHGVDYRISELKNQNETYRARILENENEIETLINSNQSIELAISKLSQKE